MVQGQLGQSQQTPAFIHAHLPVELRVNGGSLGNEVSQVPNKTPDLFLTAYGRIYGSQQPAFRLALLKRQRFTREMRQQRIATSLAALNAPQPTELTLSEWKEIAEEVEDEE